MAFDALVAAHRAGMRQLDVAPPVSSPEALLRHVDVHALVRATIAAVAPRLGVASVERIVVIRAADSPGYIDVTTSVPLLVTQRVTSAYAFAPPTLTEWTAAVAAAFDSTLFRVAPRQDGGVVLSYAFPK